ncbi:MAG: FAD:protein FMN transferase [Spirochaetales bacterium]|nr:FAD:protein FMN transferase [Spirochaetales bacterium]
MTIIAALLGSCGGDPPRHSRTEFLLGTPVTVTTYGRVSPDLLDQVFARVGEIERKMSTSEDDHTDTELLQVNAAAGTRPVSVSPDTFSVVKEALAFSESSGGAFDVTVHPLVRLWGIGTESAAIPDAEQLSAALELVDYRAVQMDPEDTAILLPRPGMGVDVGGIAKGYAADEAARILRAAGIQSALLDFGGNILTVGHKPDGSLWRIGIQTPDASRGEFLGIASVADQSVVTSGTYERFFEQGGVRYHHILDTHTGYPVQNGLASVTIIATDSIDADALSTVVFALGPEAGRLFIEALPDVEAILVTGDNEVSITSGAGEIFELTNEEYELRRP